MHRIICAFTEHRWIYEGRTVFVAPLRYDYRCERCWKVASLAEPLREADRDIRYASGGSPSRGYSSVIDFAWITDYRHRVRA